MDANLPAKIAGRYRVSRLLGRGGFGAVYDAEDELEGRRVALKVFWPEVGTGQAFRDEFRLMTRLQHPNLASVHDFGRCEEHGALYFSQDLVTGTDLAGYLQGQAVGREEIVELTLQLARALDYIHMRGLVHGDIKPSNVLVELREGAPPRAKLIDFGLARALREPSDPNVHRGSEDLVILGTPGFSAPEKVRGEPCDARADIYSLAATLYAAVVGRRPFPGGSFREVLLLQEAWVPTLAAPLAPRAGEVVGELVGRMLSADPGARPQSARSVVLELLRRELPRGPERHRDTPDRREFARMLVQYLPFVDRGRYLEVLLGKTAAVLRNAPHASASATARLPIGKHVRTVFVRAPEGLGKGRLVAELRREVQLCDGVFVEGSCWSGPGHGLGPFASIVTQLAAALGPGSAACERHADLVRLAQRRGGHESSASQLVEFLVRAAEERDYVMHVADLAKASEELRLQVDRLGRAIDHNDAPVLLCVSTEPSAKIAPMLEQLCRDNVAEVWSLRPFTAEEMQAILRGVLGESEVIGELAPMLRRLSGGHPLTFRETLRVVLEEGILLREGGSWRLHEVSSARESLHATLAERAEGRLDALGVSAWELASILYLLEVPMEERQLAELSDLGEDRAPRILDRLEGEGLVTRSATSGESVVGLAHEAVREAVRSRFEGALDETRLELASRIDELRDSDPKLVFLQARLFDEACSGLESVEALTLAADALLEAGRLQLAALVLERLITRLRRFGGRDGLERLLAAQLKLLQQAPGALEDARKEAAHYEAGILVAELVGDHRAEASFWLALADRASFASVGVDTDAVMARLDEASRAAKLARDRVLELRIANRRAEVLLGAGEVERAQGWSQRAMELLAHERASDIDKVQVLGVGLRCLALVGRFEDAKQLHELGRAIAERCPVVHRQGYLSGVAYLAALSDEPERGIPETMAAIDELTRRKLPRMLMAPLHNLGDLKLRSGDLQGAERAFAEALHLANLYGFCEHVHLNRGFLGYVVARCGRLEQGIAMLAEAKEGMRRSSGEHLAVQQLRLLDAELAHLAGQTARARRELEEMRVDFQATYEASLARWAQAALDRIEADVGGSPRAR